MRLLRRFRDAGLEEFRAYLVRLKENRTLAPPEFLLEGPEFSEPLVPSVRAEPRSFENRFVFAAWLDDTFRAAGAEAPRATDVKFWSWLTLFLFDQVCPAVLMGGENPGRKRGISPIRPDGIVAIVTSWPTHTTCIAFTGTILPGRWSSWRIPFTVRGNSPSSSPRDWRSSSVPEPWRWQRTCISTLRQADRGAERAARRRIDSANS